MKRPIRVTGTQSPVQSASMLRFEQREKLTELPGRIGDSPLIGCGGYADNRSAAVSATGWGESLMRVVMSKTACDLVAGGMSARQAVDAAVKILVERPAGRGGVIIVDHHGRVGMAFNTLRMARAWVDGDGKIRSAIDPTRPLGLMSLDRGSW